MSKVRPHPAEGTFQMQNTARRPKIAVSCDGPGIVSGAGALLLTEAVRVTGLGAGLSAGLARWRSPRAVHDPGKVITDLAVAVALGGDCLADIAVVRAEPGLLARWHPTRVVSGLVARLAGMPLLRCGRSARRGRRPGSGPGRWPGMPRPARTAADPGRRRCHDRDRVLR